MKFLLAEQGGKKVNKIINFVSQCPELWYRGLLVYRDLSRKANNGDCLVTMLQLASALVLFAFCVQVVLKV